MQARFIAPQTRPAIVTGSSTAPGSFPRSIVVAAAACGDGETKAKAKSARPAQSAPDIITAGQPDSCATKAWIGSATIAPNGQLICRIDIASTISRPSNQSVVILVATSTTMVPPAPPTVRATSATAKFSEY